MNRIIMTVAAACVATVMGTFDASAASGKRIAALDDAHWSSSVWISAANAPVVTGRIEGKNERAADGASWFLTTVKNEKRVAKARWMTAGLIKSEWHYEGDKWIWKFTIPQGATATVTLPGESEAKEYKAGTHQVEKVL